MGGWAEKKTGVAVTKRAHCSRVAWRANFSINTSGALTHEVGIWHLRRRGGHVAVCSGKAEDNPLSLEVVPLSVQVNLFFLSMVGCKFVPSFPSCSLASWGVCLGIEFSRNEPNQIHLNYATFPTRAHFDWNKVSTVTVPSFKNLINNCRLSQRYGMSTSNIDYRQRSKGSPYSIHRRIDVVCHDKLILIGCDSISVASLKAPRSCHNAYENASQSFVAQEHITIAPVLWKTWSQETEFAELFYLPLLSLFLSFLQSFSRVLSFISHFHCVWSSN